MTPEEIQTFGQAIIAAAHERIARKLYGRPWLAIVGDWEANDGQEFADQLHAINSELAREVLIYCGDNVASNLIPFSH